MRARKRARPAPGAIEFGDGGMGQGLVGLGAGAGGAWESSAAGGTGGEELDAVVGAGCGVVVAAETTGEDGEVARGGAPDVLELTIGMGGALAFAGSARAYAGRASRFPLSAAKLLAAGAGAGAGAGATGRVGGDVHSGAFGAGAVAAGATSSI